MNLSMVDDMAWLWFRALEVFMWLW